MDKEKEEVDTLFGGQSGEVVMLEDAWVTEKEERGDDKSSQPTTLVVVERSDLTDHDPIIAHSSGLSKETAEETLPDGGLTAWLVVFASFMVHFTMLGIFYSFGVYVSYYTSPPASLGSPSTISLIGSLGAALVPALGLLSGRLAEKHGYKTSVFWGSFLMALSLLLASFSTSIWQLFLTQGLLFGFGSSVAYFPSISAPSQWFDKNRGLATGIAVSGSGVGGLVFSVGTQRLLEAVGVQWTLRITSAVCLATLWGITPLVKTRIPPAPHSKTDWSVLKDVRFSLLLFTGFFATFGNLLPIYYLPSFAVERANLSVSMGATLLAVYNGSSAFGRILMGLGADRAFGRLNSLLMCCVISTASFCLLWSFAQGLPMLTLFCLVNGFVAGGFISLFPVVIASIYGTEKLPSMIGMLLSIQSAGNFGGAPLAGIIKERAGFTAAILFAGAVTAVATGFAGGIRIIQERKIWKRV
ncbi:hypothetical protein HDV05_005840 [Chytridiales sp. JEL 0842]|nr:hypothetical protein HDV05_005840 [Chytridiales sp. JEL 0842]